MKNLEVCQVKRQTKGETRKKTKNTNQKIQKINNGGNMETNDQGAHNVNTKRPGVSKIGRVGWKKPYTDTFRVP